MYNYESCPIAPWVAEIVTRMHEAAAAGTPVVNLSYTHPRGYIPNQIIRRPEVRKVMAGWSYDNARTAPTPIPDHWFLPPGIDIAYGPLAPFEQEIARREAEAAQEAAAKTAMDGERHISVIDLTTFHPRGGIPLVVMARLSRRKSKTWRTEMLAEIERLQGEANRAEAFSQTQKDRAEAMASKGSDPNPLLASAQRELEKAATARAQIVMIKKEMGS